MMTLDSNLVDELLKHYKTPEDLIGEQGLLKQLTVALLERALSVAMDKPASHALADSPRFAAYHSSTQMGRFESARSPLPGSSSANHSEYDEKILSLYARGLSTPEIQAHLAEIYAVTVSPEKVASVTDALIDEAGAWQSRPLERLYPIMYFDSLQVKSCEAGRIANRSVYLAIGVNSQGLREVLGLWMADSENGMPDTGFWCTLIAELKNRGVQDIFIACVDGALGLEAAVKAEFPQAVVQLCIAQMVRRSLKFVPTRSHKAVAADLKLIYRATTIEEAERCLDSFVEKWDSTYAAIGQLWRKNWVRVTPFFAYPDEIRKVIYSTNAVELVGANLRKVTNNRGSFGSDEVIRKSFHLALSNIAAKRTMPIRDWKTALNRFSILFESRMPVS
ncbi:MAG: IS256 family transposase [Rhodocyclaceae bacterium]|nr:IS256 family transposase [Rhodocyclaceae bacterium]MBP6279842.1 IS256 family transposase [Rhodocyclaceae bacterium]